MPDIEAALKLNLMNIEQRITDACRRAGRSRQDVRLFAVTKYVDVGVARCLLDLGVEDLAESRPQALWQKAEALPQARWHLVGHLQRNKIGKTLPVVGLIQSVDSIRLLEALDAEAGKQGRIVSVLLEFNLSGELAKHGFAKADAFSLTAALGQLQNVHVHGLMTMAAVSADTEEARPTFAALRDLRERMQGDVVAPHNLHELSMGMSYDFEVAIEEGATMVRIGSALFQGLENVAS